MSGVVETLYELKYNPFGCGPYIASFYTTVGESQNNLLLAPLVIPLCTHPFFGRKLYNSNINSTIWSIFDDRAKLYDLQERIDGFQSLTEQSIQYCLANDWLSVDERFLTVRVCDEPDANFKNSKSAGRLGRLFSGHSVVEIYAFLGVKPQ